jgi:cell division septation protein DedD
MKSRASANQLWLLTSEPNKALFDGLKPFFKKSVLSQGAIFRVQVGPFKSIENAREFCAVLSARGVETGCLPISSESE